MAKSDICSSDEELLCFTEGDPDCEHNIAENMFSINSKWYNAESRYCSKCSLRGIVIFPYEFHYSDETIAMIKSNC